MRNSPSSGGAGPGWTDRCRPAGRSRPAGRGRREPALSWPFPVGSRNASWSEEDAAKAATYRACADVVIWTPGVTSGNPISLNLLPDFAAIDNADEREQ